jgi:hypothetical protein
MYTARTNERSIVRSPPPLLLEPPMHTPDRAAAHGPSPLTLAYVAALGLLAALLRVAPYYVDGWNGWNLMPVGALALFAGSRVRSPWAWLVPLAVMLAADLLLVYPLAKLGHPAFSVIRTPLVYLSFLAYVGLGHLVRRDESSPAVIGGAALLGGVQFFVLTNFAAWLVDVNSTTPWYTADLAGLGRCYTMGLPFYKNTLASDLLFSAVIFVGHAALAWALRRRGQGQPSPAAISWRDLAARGQQQDAVYRRDEEVSR